VWSLHAPRFFAFSATSYGVHWQHRAWMLTHVLGGTFPLFLGPFLLWSGLRRYRPTLHRWIGRTYLVTGAIGVGGGAALSLVSAHPPFSLYVATFTLAVAWFFAAFMAYRAIRNRRVEIHRDWVIRSYVLTATFVICRLAMRMPLFGSLGIEGVTATIWVSWIVPVLIAEIFIQWRRAGRIHERKTTMRLGTGH
jgi:hypothetical protein